MRWMGGFQTEQKISIAGVSGGVPLADKNRYPAPGSRPEEYAVLGTAASDVAFNPVST